MLLLVLQTPLEKKNSISPNLIVQVEWFAVTSRLNPAVVLLFGWSVGIVRNKRNLKCDGSNRFSNEWEIFREVIRTLSGCEFQ